MTLKWKGACARWSCLLAGAKHWGFDNLAKLCKSPHTFRFTFSSSRTTKVCYSVRPGLASSGSRSTSHLHFFSGRGTHTHCKVTVLHQTAKGRHQTSCTWFEHLLGHELNHWNKKDPLFLLLLLPLWGFDKSLSLAPKLQAMALEGTQKPHLHSWPSRGSTRAALPSSESGGTGEVPPMSSQGKARQDSILSIEACFKFWACFKLRLEFGHLLLCEAGPPVPIRSSILQGPGCLLAKSPPVSYGCKINTQRIFS